MMGARRFFGSFGVAFLAAAALGWFALDGCSYGTGVTPTCESGGGQACDPLPKCDVGLGVLAQTDECCMLRGNDQYGIVCMKEFPSGNDFRKVCAMTGMGGAAPDANCCNAAKSEFDNCMKGMK